MHILIDEQRYYIIQCHVYSLTGMYICMLYRHNTRAQYAHLRMHFIVILLRPVNGGALLYRVAKNDRFKFIGM